ncbi:MAG: FAD-dependent oxidoreductase [bacterium]
MKEEIKKTYIVVENKKETTDVSTLQLMLVDDSGDSVKKSIPTYCPGQFITVYFPELGTPEGKAYSISSAPHEKTINITVKAIGSFSHRLVAMMPGSTLVASLPYGFFYSESNDTSLSMIASGIGVAPFRSMSLDSLKKNPSRKITILYSVRTSADLLFKKEFSDLESKYDNFRVFYFLTRETESTLRVLSGRITINDILGNVRSRCELVVSHDNWEFLMCGSISFVRDMWRGLRAHGVSEVAIYTEAFFSH